MKFSQAKPGKRGWWCCAGVALLCCAPSLFAEQANMVLTGVGDNGVLGGIYVGPYVATINGVTTDVICDDFVDESSVGEQWTANVSTLSDLSKTKWGSSASQQYQQVAWLSLQLMNPPTSCGNANCAGDIQYAIWEVFDPPSSGLDPFDYLSGQDKTNAQWWLSQAQQNYAGVDYSNIAIYTPVNGGPPQEFVTVKTPEPPLVALLMVNLFGILALLFVYRRRRARLQLALS